MIKHIFLSLLFLASVAGAKGIIEGTIFDSADKPIVGANVSVVGARTGSSSDLDGNYKIVLDEGTWTVVVSHINYKEKQRPVIVFDNETTELDFNLESSAFKAEDVVIRGTIQTNNENSVLTSRKKDDVVSDVISSEQISKNGDGNVGAALKRVTGVTVQNGKDIFVRGMGERYSNVQLNGNSIPSTNPDRKEVPTDILSSGLVDHISVQKTYTVDQPGEFGGGTVQVHTKRFPSDRHLKVGFSTTYNSQSTGKKYLTYAGGSRDHFGYDDGTRQLPSELDSRMSGDEGVDLAQTFQNVWTPTERTSRLGKKWSIEWADILTLRNENRVGIVTSFSIGHKSSSQTEEYRNIYQPGLWSSNYSKTVGSEKSDVSLMANVFFELGPHSQIGFRNLFINQAQDKTTNVNGYYYNSDGDYDQNILKFVRRSLVTNSVEYKLRGLKAQASVSHTQREEPDTRNSHYAYNHNTGQYEIVLSQRGNYHFFSDQSDRIIEANVDQKLRVSDFEFKTGYQFVLKDRQFDARKFTYDSTGAPLPFPDDLRGAQAEEALSPNNIEGFHLRFFENTRSSDSYVADQTRNSVYLTTKWNSSPTFDIGLGVRLEQDNQTLNDEELTSSTDILPALNSNWRITENQVLRGAASITVARPEFRELADFYFSDFIGGRTTYGNGEIERTRIVNTDLRWEHFFGIGEVAAIGVFHKSFDKPIELRHRNSQQPEVVYDNAESATLYGAEFELRKRLLNRITVGSNFTLLKSSVKYGDDVHNQANTDRPLQGQSPYTININAGWDSKTLGAMVNIAYNRFGKRISSVGSFNQQDDEYELPFDSLDLLMSKKFGSWKTKLSFGNLLNEEVVFEQAGIVTNRYSIGRTVSLGFSKEF